MKSKIISIFVIGVFLMLLISIVPAISLSENTFIEEIRVHGEDFDDIEGQWEHYSDYAIRMSPGGSDCTVWYLISLGCLEVEENDFEVGIRACDWGIFGDGVDFRVYNFDVSSWHLVKEGCCGQDDLKSCYYPLEDPNQYISDEGCVYYKLYAEDDDDALLYEVMVKFIPLEQPEEPDLETEGKIDISIYWKNTPRKCSGEFIVTNVGEPGSELFWKISSYPSFGSNWFFNPSSGYLDYEEEQTVKVDFYCERHSYLQQTTYTGDIKVINMEDNDDYDKVHVRCVIPRYKPSNYNNNLLEIMFERFPLLEKLLNLIKIC